MQLLRDVAQQARFAAMQPGQIDARNGGVTATIRAQDLSLVLGSIKIRKYSRGETALLCALSESPVIQLSCRDWHRSRAEAARYGRSPLRVSPLQRGDIGDLIDRVARERGRREVVKTWGVGIRTLRNEDRYCLAGGSKGKEDADRAMLGILLGESL